MSDATEPPRNEAALSSARHGARLPGGAPEPFCERCGTSVEAAAIGPWVGLCHCPACDIFACRWCWEEAAEGCPECGIRYAPLVVAAAAAAPVAATAVAAAGALAAATPIATSSAAVAPAIETRTAAGGGTPQATVVGPVAAGATRQAVRLLRTQRVPAGIGVVVLVAAVFALLLGNPFQAGGVQGVLDATDTPSAPSSVDASEPTATGTSDAGGASVAPATSEPAATDPARQPAGAPGSTSRPAATPTLAPDATPAPPTAKPTPTPTALPHATPPPTPTPTPPPTPTPAPTPTPQPACQTVPNMVGLTVAKARNAWNGAGFTGAFTAPTGPAKAIVTSQSQPPGACLPANTGITVTT